MISVLPDIYTLSAICVRILIRWEIRWEIRCETPFGLFLYCGLETFQIHPQRPKHLAKYMEHAHMKHHLFRKTMKTKNRNKVTFKIRDWTLRLSGDCPNEKSCLTAEPFSRRPCFFSSRTLCCPNVDEQGPSSFRVLPEVPIQSWNTKWKDMLKYSQWQRSLVLAWQGRARSLILPINNQPVPAHAKTRELPAALRQGLARFLIEILA